MTNNKSLLFMLFVLVVGSGAFAVNHIKQNQLPVEDERTLLPTEIGLSYNDFLTDLEKDCPYYEPSGVQYRECLVNLLAQREREVGEYQADLISDIQASTNPEFITARKTFVTHLEELERTWKPYRDQLCIATFDSMWGGSNQGGAMNTCRLYETERYYRLLQNLRSEWIHQ